MRLIDADALEEKFRRVTAFERTQKDKGMVYVERSCIDGMPNIDPVHAAGGCYCWECDSWCEEMKKGRIDLGNATAPCSVWSDQENGHTRYTRHSDFCSYGCREESRCEKD